MKRNIIMLIGLGILSILVVALSFMASAAVLSRVL